MKPQFSVVIPTRHRPEFVREALRYASLQRGDFEVIVSDNWIDPALSARAAFDAASIPNSVYVRPPVPLGMVENWNFALEHTRGEYVLFFTDKNFLLPGALERLAAVIQNHPAEIYNWSGETFTPLNYAAPFASGFYGMSRPAGQKNSVLMDARAVLETKASGYVPREQSSPIDYALGKICFGAFRRSLIERIVTRCGKLFFPISPDYTSMILGLSHTKSIVDVGWAGIMQINTLISNGMLCATDDVAAEAFLRSVGVFDELQQSGLVPGLFTSVAANVAFDYLQMNARFNLDFGIDRENWLQQACMDVYSPTRNWSSEDIRLGQYAILAAAMNEVGMQDSNALINSAKLKPIAKVPKSLRSRIFEKVRTNSLLSSGAAPLLWSAGKMGLLNRLDTEFHLSLSLCMDGGRK
nr:glycosyltransferase family A protein [uncultured Rhodoferax sp.]